MLRKRFFHKAHYQRFVVIRRPAVRLIVALQMYFGEFCVRSFERAKLHEIVLKKFLKIHSMHHFKPNKRNQQCVDKSML